MIESLLGTLKSQVGEQLTSKTKLPASNLDDVFSVIGNVVKKETTKQLTGGNLSNILGLFSDKTNSKTSKQLGVNLNTGVVSDLISKLGISPKLAKEIAAIAIPSLIALITKSTKPAASTKSTKATASAKSTKATTGTKGTKAAASTKSTKPTASTKSTKATTGTKGTEPTASAKTTKAPAKATAAKTTKAPAKTKSASKGASSVLEDLLGAAGGKKGSLGNIAKGLLGKFFK